MFEEHKIQHFGRIEYWSSLTHAELAAIWSALLMTLSNRKVNIKTDSQAAIDDIKQAKKIRNKNKWFLLNNRSVINDICALIKLKKLEVELIKVKAHVGIQGNKIADSLVKERAS